MPESSKRKRQRRALSKAKNKSATSAELVEAERVFEEVRAEDESTYKGKRRHYFVESLISLMTILATLVGAAISIPKFFDAVIGDRFQTLEVIFLSAASVFMVITLVVRLFSRKD